MRSAHARGLHTIAVYSDADYRAPHVRYADEAIRLGPAQAEQSYLAIDRVITAAHETGAEAIHPGYGFLSENPEFAKACLSAGLVFVGPSPDVIRLMGDKSAAKQRMRLAGITCIPGYEEKYEKGVENDDVLLQEAQRLGYPLMVKAAAGGGGHGMRLVKAPEEMPEALRSARAEARSAFGSDLLILEQALTRPHHIEIQVLADTQGHIIHLGERECSIQRRFQKIIEESPSPVVDDALREKMGAVAIAITREIGYVGAGTVEFLLDEDGEFYFLEMNTRLQVEHAVTEAVTELDLVEWQLAIACGESLPMEQQAVTFRGHAIEARLYAEDPASGFLPRSGKVLVWKAPTGVGVRIDHALETGGTIPSWYDPLLARFITWGNSRETARKRLLRALEHCVLLGSDTNRTFLIKCLEDPRFEEGKVTTDFVAGIDVMEHNSSSLRAILAAILYVRLGFTSGENLWAGWASNDVPRKTSLSLQQGDIRLNFMIEVCDQSRFLVAMEGEKECHITLDHFKDSQVYYRFNDRYRSAHWIQIGDELYIGDLEGENLYSVHHPDINPNNDTKPDDGNLRSPVQGTVTGVPVKEGEAVDSDALLMVIEAMKMEYSLRSPFPGMITGVTVCSGQQVQKGELLVTVVSSGTRELQA